MNLQYKRYLLPTRLLFFILSIFLICLIPTQNFYANELDETTISAENSEAEPDIFIYSLEDRNDPFIPFITAKAATSPVDMNEIIDNNVTLTGMQLFEPGQLTLVALLKSGQEDLAMVEDFTGKGYVLTRGTLIGRRGIVKSISPNTVTIEETAETRAGKKIITEIEMTLKKEGEE